jgi:hypothetical protein
MNIKIPKVLVAAPTSNKKEYCFNKWLENTKALTYPNLDLLLVDNSETDCYSKLLSKRVIRNHHIKFKDKPLLQRIEESMNYIREYALHYNYDYIFIKETDNLSPPNIIERLLTHNKAVTSGMYDIGHGKDRELCILLMDDSEHHKVPYKIGKDNYSFADGSLKKCFNAGLGTTLIHKNVLQKFPFRWVKGTNAYIDLTFAEDCMKWNYDFFVDTSIMSEHLNIDWKKEGVTV